MEDGGGMAETRLKAVGGQRIALTEVGDKKDVCS